MRIGARRFPVPAILPATSATSLRSSASADSRPGYVIAASSTIAERPNFCGVTQFGALEYLPHSSGLHQRASGSKAQQQSWGTYVPHSTAQRPFPSSLGTPDLLHHPSRVFPLAASSPSVPVKGTRQPSGRVNHVTSRLLMDSFHEVHSLLLPNSLPLLDRFRQLSLANPQELPSPSIQLRRPPFAPPHGAFMALPFTHAGGPPAVAAASPRAERPQLAATHPTIEGHGPHLYSLEVPHRDQAVLAQGFTQAELARDSHRVLDFDQPIPGLSLSFVVTVPGERSAARKDFECGQAPSIRWCHVHSSSKDPRSLKQLTVAALQEFVHPNGDLKQEAFSCSPELEPISSRATARHHSAPAQPPKQQPASSEERRQPAGVQRREQEQRGQDADEEKRRRRWLARGNAPSTYKTLAEMKQEKTEAQRQLKKRARAADPLEDQPTRSVRSMSTLSDSSPREHTPKQRSGICPPPPVQLPTGAPMEALAPPQAAPLGTAPLLALMGIISGLDNASLEAARAFLNVQANTTASRPSTRVQPQPLSPERQLLSPQERLSGSNPLSGSNHLGRPPSGPSYSGSRGKGTSSSQERPSSSARP